MEYGLIVVAVAGLIAAVVFALGGPTVGMYDHACDRWKSQETGASADC